LAFIYLEKCGDDSLAEGVVLDFPQLLIDADRMLHVCISRRLSAILAVTCEQ